MARRRRRGKGVRGLSAINSVEGMDRKSVRIEYAVWTAR